LPRELCNTSWLHDRCASIPIIRYNRHPIDCRAPHPGLRVCIAFAPASYVYWPLALVLAWVERNRALLVFGLVYLVIVDFGWILIPRSPRLFLASTAAVLLLGSLGFAFAERRAQRPAS
jgi:hypothetical protein